MEKNDQIQQIIIALSLIVIGVTGRILLRDLLPHTPHIYITLNGITQPVFMMDMFFIVAIISLFSGILLKGYYSYVVPLSVMLITDICYGNTYIFLFTWSGFVSIGLIGHFAKKGLSFNAISVFKLVGAGIGSTLLYDLWTNFGCWLGWYPHSLNGLTMCYTLAVPFMLWHLLSTSVLLILLAYPLLYITEYNLKLKTIKPLENYIPAGASLFLAIISLLILVI